MNGVTDGWTLLVIFGMAGVTVLTRCFFFILDRAWAMPAWADRALRYAPVAALAGVVLPEVVMTNGQFAASWHDARVWAAVVGAIAYFWRRSVLATLIIGMAVYLPLHLGLGW
ncbi:MAG: branched-chain amino acid transporter [Ramlibacter sp.]|jgi:branched-subunit amino acid transport protein|nr:branched-chain amino acid transporter [Ramlibacter sp.]MDB5913417.1 branched-chain amino acid transporter [Ramlibacter sp.]